MATTSSALVGLSCFGFGGLSFHCQKLFRSGRCFLLLKRLSLSARSSCATDLLSYAGAGAFPWPPC